MIRILLVVFITVIGSVFPALIASSIGKAYYNRQSKMFEEQLEVQAGYYEELAKNNFEMRRFKHDYKNMLIGVGEMIREGNTVGAMELLQRGNGTVSENSFREFDTGNGIVDAILSEKQKKADSANTVIKFEGAVPAEKIAPTDLCVIFGNTIDNAIEACEGISSEDENIICVTCYSAGMFFFVTVSNPVKSTVPITNNNVKTSKSNKTEHGFGLYSLKKTIKKYHGTLSLECIDNMFSVNLELEMLF